MGSSIAINGFAISPVLTITQLLNHAIKTRPTVVDRQEMILSDRNKGIIYCFVQASQQSYFFHALATPYS